MANVVKQVETPRALGASFVHQSLHGYAGGHRLIESSFDFPPDLARLVLRMSDLSGGNVVSGFDDYLTAYPLKSSGMYAFAKTWLAAEMPRPGCVWTHTLLFSLSELTFPSLEPFVALFRRPQIPNDTGYYANRLEFQDFDQIDSIQEGFVLDRDCCMRLLAAFYKPNSPVLILPARSSLEHQKLVLSLWSQQWPSLRATTTFSTGSLSSRAFEGRPFDIQSVPISAVREAQLEISSASSTEVIISDNIAVTVPEWAPDAAEDLLISGGQDFRKFLWEAADSESRRSDFARLAEVFHTVAHSDVECVIRNISQNFPLPGQAVKAKARILGEAENGPRETELLSALGSVDNFAPFDAKTLGLRDRGAKLASCPEDAKRLVKFLFRATINPLGAEVLAGLVSGLDAQAARRLAAEHPHFLSTIVAAKPSLATSSQLWVGVDSNRSEVFEAVARTKDLDDATVKGVVWALVEAQCEDLFRRALEVWGRRAVFGAMDWLDHSVSNFSESFRGLLTFHTKEVMDWVETGERKSRNGLLGAAHILAPYSYQVRDRNTNVWEALKRELDGYEEAYLAAFLLALGLGNAPEQPVELIKKYFELIYQLAWEGKLDHKTWEILDPVVPEISWPNNWDRCERMIRGLIASFIRYQWPAHKIYHCVSQPRLRDRLPKSAKKVDGGASFLDRLRAVEPAYQ